MANNVPDTAGNTPEPQTLEVGEWFLLESPECTNRFSVQEKTHGGCRIVCSTPYHHGRAKEQLEEIVKSHNERVAAPSQEAAPKVEHFNAIEPVDGCDCNPCAARRYDIKCQMCGFRALACGHNVIWDKVAEPAPSPAMNESTEREEFEEWAEESYGGDMSRFPVREDEPLSDEYHAADIQRAWEAWKYRAAREPKSVAPSPATKDTPRTKFFIDTEFIESGPGCSIDLLSIGIVCEDGREFYAESASANMAMASDWVMENVVPHLTGDKELLGPMGERITKFVGDCKPEFWGYYADYDWVVFCQIFGIMMDLPKGWPMYCRDLKQLCDSLGNPKLPAQSSTEHNALNDARWNLQAYKFLQTFDAGAQSRTPTNLESRTEPEYPYVNSCAQTSYPHRCANLESRTVAPQPEPFHLRKLLHEVGIVCQCGSVEEWTVQGIRERLRKVMHEYGVATGRVELAGAAALPATPKVLGATKAYARKIGWLFRTTDPTKPDALWEEMVVRAEEELLNYAAASVPTASSPMKESQEWMREASEEIRQCCLQQAGYLNAGLTAQIIAKHYAASSPEPNQGSAPRCESVLRQDGSTFLCSKPAGHSSAHEQSDWEWWDEPELPSPPVASQPAKEED